MQRLWKFNSISKIQFNRILSNKKHRTTWVFDKIYNEHKEVLKLYKIEKTFKDNGPKYENNSHMWSGQSQEKVLNDSYKEESKKYEISWIS